jgi:hypothetical protein
MSCERIAIGLMMVMSAALIGCGGDTCIRNSDCPPSMSCSLEGACELRPDASTLDAAIVDGREHADAEVRDAAPDAEPDAMIDAELDAAPDASLEDTDPEADAAPDAAPDASMDAAPDAVIDATS